MKCLNIYKALATGVSRLSLKGRRVACLTLQAEQFLWELLSSALAPWKQPQIRCI